VRIAVDSAITPAVDARRGCGVLAVGSFAFPFAILGRIGQFYNRNFEVSLWLIEQGEVSFIKMCLPPVRVFLFDQDVGVEKWTREGAKKMGRRSVYPKHLRRCAASDGHADIVSNSNYSLVVVDERLLVDEKVMLLL
jgi:hypothetical protein